MKKWKFLVIKKKLMKTLYKRGVKSECSDYRGISLVSVGSKLLSMMILLRLRNTIDNVLKEEQCSFRKGRGCIDQIVIPRLIIKKSLSHQTPSVLSFISYEQVFDSADRKALVKILSMCSISDKYIKVISAI